MKDKKLSMIGHAHLDSVWLWNWQEGFQEAKATLRSALDRMKEDENFIFTCSSAAHFSWIERNAPAMFEEIRTRVKEGRLEIVGGWWVEADCNIPSGESFVRQGLYGQRYFLEKFGKIAKSGFNADSFGHNGNLPQILRKSGLENYVFMRPMPLEKSLPGRIFRWQSADGSEVLAYRIPYEYLSWGKDLDRYAKRLLTELEDGEDQLMMFYGVGNHGGGPTKENIRSIYRLNDDPDYPRMEMESTEDFFQAIRENNKEYPVYIGDLQHHASGCYSVHSSIKKQNRQAETLLQTAETWSSVAQSLEKQAYPNNFKEAWQGILFNQFHDIMAGTSIRSAYDDASYLFGRAMAAGQENLNYALQALSWDIDIKHEDKRLPIVVFNPHTWAGKMLAELQVNSLSNDNFRLEDSSGREIPAQRIQSEAATSNGSRLIFVADLPALGYEVFYLYLKTEEHKSFPAVCVKDEAETKILENDRFRIRLNPENGFMDELIDKKHELNILRRAGAVPSVYNDPHDTWAHNIFKFDDYLADMEVKDIRLIEEGPVRSAFRVKYAYGESYLWQEFRLYKDFDYIEVKVRADWRTPHTQLKLRFPVNFNFRKPTLEIPFGYIEKSANGEEEPGQSWFDMSGEHFRNNLMYGLAVANDAKYSYSFDIDEMKLTVLRNSVYAHHDPKKLDPDALYDYTDDGLQEFTYIMLPHEGGWKDSDIVKRSKEINKRPDCIIETGHKGNLPTKQAFVKIDAAHVLLTLIKEAEDKDGLILRFYEYKKQSETVTVELLFCKRRFTLDFAPCEIKTVKVPYDISREVKEVNMLEM